MIVFALAGDSTITRVLVASSFLLGKRMGLNLSPPLATPRDFEEVDVFAKLLSFSAFATLATFFLTGFVLGLAFFFTEFAFFFIDFLLSIFLNLYKLKSLHRLYRTNSFNSIEKN